MINSNIVKKLNILGLSALLSVSVLPVQNLMAGVQTEKEAMLPAFLGAEGGGRYASGGRGQKVYLVTNLEDYAGDEAPVEGSLRYGLKSNTTVVFQVAGNIELKRSLTFKNLKNITLAGQTAPGDGITISGWDTNISDSENMIIRYLRFRPGAINVHNGSDSMDALWGRDHNNFIIDHCSFSWNTDETLSVYRGENGTVQWNMVYESLTLSGHSKGRHGYGGISGGNNVTYHHNLYANHTSRNPRLGGGYRGKADGDHIAVVEMSNNLIYNWGFNTCYGGGYTFTNFRNNYELAGPGTRDNVAKRVIDAGEKSKAGGFHISGNYIASYKNRGSGTLTGILDDSSSEVKMSGDREGDSKTVFQNTPYTSGDSTGPSAGITSEAFDSFVPADALTVCSEVLEKAGATYPRRDSLDARIAAAVENGLGQYINTEHQVGGFISPGGEITDRRPDGFDRDRDGMSDAWELEHGLNPSDPEDRNQTNLSAEGYTNLEMYLNSLVDMEHRAENPKAEITSIQNNQYFNQGDTITVTARAGSEYGHRIEKVDFFYSTETMTERMGSVSSPEDGNYSVSLDGLSDGSYYIMARAYDNAGNKTQTSPIEIHVNAPNQTLEAEGWKTVDVGIPALAGTGSFMDGILTVKGNGKLGASEGASAVMISGRRSDAKTDDFHYVYKELSGDGEITARLESITAVDNHAFAGIMIREDLTDGAKTAALGLSWVKYTNLPWSMYLTGRNETGGSFDTLSETLDSQEKAADAGIMLQPDIPFKNGADTLGCWMKLVRAGNEFSAYHSSDGKAWTLIGTRQIEMKEAVYAGFAADSNKTANEIEQLNTARFSNVEIREN